MITSLLHRLRRLAVTGMVVAASVGAMHSAHAYVYSIDDGSAEDAIGLTSGGTVVALNQFPVTAGNNRIGSISAAFGAPGGTSSASLLGSSFTVLLYSDPNGDGSPADAVLLTSATGTITSIDSNSFITVPIPATTITGTDFFIGYAVANTAGTYPAALDETTGAGRSYIAGAGAGDPIDLTDLNDNDIPVSSLSDVGFSGNWLIRANTAAVPEPSTYAMLGTALLGGVLLRRRRLAAAR